MNKRVGACAALIATLALSTGARAADRAARTPERLRAYLEQCRAAHVCNGVYLVAQGNRVILNDAIGDTGDPARTPLRTDSQFDIGSIAKEFTAAAVLKLAAQGKVGLDQPVAAYLPDFPYRDVTVSHLLSHTSGIPEALAYYDALLRAGHLPGPVTCADVVAVLAKQNKPPRFAPGTRYEYNNGGFVVLAALVERVSGQSFGDYLAANFFRPLGLRHTMLRTPGNEPAAATRTFGFHATPDGGRRPVDQIPGFFIRGAGGIYSTARDLLRWQEALDAGMVIPRALLARATTPVRLSDGREAPYGLGFMLRTDAEGGARIGHGGHWRGFKSDLSHYPARGLTVIQLTNNDENESVDASAAALVTIMAGGSPAPVRESIEWPLYDRLQTGSAEAVKAWFAQTTAAQPERYAVREAALNELGYRLIEAHQPDRAVTVLELATQAFPKSANAFDSLADGYEAKGDIAAARRSVATAIALAPETADYQRHAERLAAK